jgi:hypothetical protein
MLFQATCNSYCLYCGRPIFEKDVFNINVDTESIICLSCFIHSSNSSDTCCHHWALTKNVIDYKEVSRLSFADLNSMEDMKCLTCSERIDYLGKSQYIKFQFYNIKSPNSPIVSSSFIYHEPIYSLNNPDYQIYVDIQQMLNANEHKQHWEKLNEHLKHLIIRNPCFKETPPIREKYINTKCKIINYFAFLPYISTFELLIEEGINYVKLHRKPPFKIEDDESVILEYVEKVVPKVDINSLNFIYRHFVMQGLEGTGLEGLDLYGIANECYDENLNFAAEKFLWDLISPSIKDAILDRK